MDVRRLEAALIDVVVREGLRGVGAVLVHRDGHFSMSHALRRLDMRCGPFTWMRQRQQQRAVRRSSFRGPLEEAQGTLSSQLAAAAAGGGGGGGGSSGCGCRRMSDPARGSGWAGRDQSRVERSPARCSGRDAQNKHTPINSAASTSQ